MDICELCTESNENGTEEVLLNENSMESFSKCLKFFQIK